MSERLDRRERKEASEVKEKAHAFRCRSLQQSLSSYDNLHFISFRGVPGAKI